MHQPAQEAAGTASSSGSVEPEPGAQLREVRRRAPIRRASPAPDRRARDGSARRRASRRRAARESSAAIVERRTAARRPAMIVRNAPGVRQLRPRLPCRNPSSPSRFRAFVRPCRVRPSSWAAARPMPGVARERRGDLPALEHAARGVERQHARSPSSSRPASTCATCRALTRPRDGATTRQARDDVLQLANVARPAVPRRARPARRRRAPPACPTSPSIRRQNALRERGTSSTRSRSGGSRMRTTARRNSRSSRNRPRPTASASGRLVAATHADVHRARHVLADRRISRSCSARSSFACASRRQLAHLVEKQRAAAALPRTGPAACRSRR